MSPLVRSLTGVVIVILVGTASYWAGAQQEKINSATAELAKTAVPVDLDHLRAENARLVAENEQLMGQRTTLQEIGATVPAQGDGGMASQAASAGTAERLHILAELQQKKLASVSVPVVSRDGKLQGGFAELFDLTPAEKDTLQQAIDQARQQTEQVAVANANVTRRADGAIVISMPPSAAGAAVRDGLMNTFAQTLGPERNEAFLALNQGNQPNQFANAMNGFGADDRTITISHVTGPDGTSRISLNDAHRSPTPGGGGNMSMATSANDLSKLPENFRWLGPLIPADF